MELQIKNMSQKSLTGFSYIGSRETVKKDYIRMEQVKVSIVTVVYNGVDTIRQTIENVLSQTYPDIEYIIIDGNSSDGTQAVIQNYNEKISYWCSEPDNGIYDAMNKGISHAGGELVGIINSDDWYEKDAVRKVVNVYNQTNADVIYGEIAMVNEMGERIDVTRDSVIPPHPGMFVKKAVYQKYGGFLTKYRIAADHEFKLRMYAEKLKIVHCNDILANFRITGISNSNLELCCYEASEIELDYADRCPEILPSKKQLEINYRSARLRRCITKNSNQIYDILNNEYGPFEKGIVLWGAGIWGHRMLPVFNKRGISICFVDRNKERWGSKIDGVEVREPQICRDFDGTIVVCVLDQQQTIEQQIRESFKCNAQIITLDMLWETIQGQLENL